MERQDIINELKGIDNIRIKFYQKSPYQKRRYKPEYVESEAWVYTPATKYGYLITEKDFNNAEYRKEFFDMVVSEATNYRNFYNYRKRKEVKCIK